MKIVHKILIAMLCFPFTLVLVVWFNQDLLIYPTHAAPRNSADNPPRFRHPRDRHLPFRELNISSGGEWLEGWLIGDSPNRSTVIFLHQNAMNLGSRLQFIQTYIKEVQVNFMIVAYRGYSLSTGTPTQRGLEIDSLAILKYAVQTLPSSRLYVHGRSLGGATALYALAHSQFRDRVKGLILENTFSTLLQVVKDIMPFYISIFSSLILSNHWPSIERVARLDKDLPVLFIKTLNDQIVKIDQMQKLQRACSSERVESVVLEQGDHNSNVFRNREKYFGAIRQMVGGDIGKRQSNSQIRINQQGQL